ncbi:tetratricopeptide repeat protein [Chitinophaga lutea]|nr:tetratricopeptide repeat protein [Chitinophaga lutea]
MTKRNSIIAALLLLTAAAQAQEQKSRLQLADEAYQLEQYAVAGPLYKELTDKGKKLSSGHWLKMAHSFRASGQLQHAAGVYRQLLEQPGAPASARYAYAETLQRLGAYDSARAQYQQYATANADSLQLRRTALQSCDSAAAWRSQSSPVNLRPIHSLNTPGSDMVTAVTDKGIVVVSTGYRPEIRETQVPNDKRMRQPFYKAYYYEPYSSTNPNLYGEELAPSIFKSFATHIGPVFVNRAGDTLYATVTMGRKGAANGVRDLQLWQSVKKGGKWAPLTLLPGINLAGYSAGHAVVNNAGDVLYFMSDRPGGLGQTDIWYSEKQADGNWGEPKNCGRFVNTIAAEGFPSMHEGVLYFSSKGHPGLGGYDVYRATGARENWSAPQNLKAPFSSPGDDVSFVLKPDGSGGYLSSDKAGGMGSDDVYRFEGKR